MHDMTKYKTKDKTRHGGKNITQSRKWQVSELQIWQVTCGVLHLPPLSCSTLAGPYGGCTSPLRLVRFPSWLIRPISFAGVPGTPSGYPICTRYSPEHFRSPNTIVLYINLYLSTILRLLVMSVISSGTSNNLWYVKHADPMGSRTM